MYMKSILIIEDEPDYLTLLRDQLVKKAYKVIEAEDGVEGLSLAKSYQPDVILLDIRLPGIDGLSMLESLRKDSYGKKAKVIILTNIEPDDIILKKITTNHPAFYLVKSDIQLNDLMKRINEVFSTQVAL